MKPGDQVRLVNTAEVNPPGCGVFAPPEGSIGIVTEMWTSERTKDRVGVDIDGEGWWFRSKFLEVLT